MAIKTTPFRRICLYIIDHAECKTELGLTTKLDYTTPIKEVHLYPDNKATVVLIDEHGIVQKWQCTIKE